MRTLTIPAAVLSLACSCLIAFACSQDTPQPLAVDSVAQRAQPSRTVAHCEGDRIGIGVLPALPFSSDFYNNKILVVTSTVIAQKTVCTVDPELSDLYHVVVVGTEPAFRTTLAVPADANICPGDRFDLTSTIGCGGPHVRLQIIHIR